MVCRQAASFSILRMLNERFDVAGLTISGAAFDDDQQGICGSVFDLELLSPDLGINHAVVGFGFV